MTPAMQCFRNARVPGEGGNDTRLVDLHVAAGHIVALGPDLPPCAGAAVDLGGRLVLPGAIDAHVHFDEPGYDFREDFAHGSAGAAAGGVTTVVDMPCTSVPEITDVAALAFKRERVTPKAHVDFACWGGVSANTLAEPGWADDMAALAAAGVVGFKVYTLSGMDSYRHLDPAALRQVFAVAAGLRRVVCVHAEEPTIVLALQRAAEAAGRVLPRDYARSRPAVAEAIAIATVGELALETGAAVHIAHVSSARGVALVRAYRAAGADLTAETCPHLVGFHEDDFERLGGLLKTAPPVRTAADNAALWQALADGGLTYIASDHAPCRYPQDKTTGSIWRDYGGVPGVELLLPFAAHYGWRAGRFDLARLVELVAAGPARRLGLWPQKGQLTVGADADFVCLDLDQPWPVCGARLQSKGKYTPLDGAVLDVRVAATYVRGRLAYEAATGVADAARGAGRFVPRMA